MFHPLFEAGPRFCSQARSTAGRSTAPSLRGDVCEGTDVRGDVWARGDLRELFSIGSPALERHGQKQASQ